MRVAHRLRKQRTEVLIPADAALGCQNVGCCLAKWSCAPDYSLKGLQDPTEPQDLQEMRTSQGRVLHGVLGATQGSLQAIPEC